ncbi:ABC transporter substrate-binding protein [Halobium palmae]|uniref:ABC transporter substrate-binding protein n=1 Tax=Halobium palmae TaxID=1776492 RepID=A0ABD5RVB6_9EURY
MSSEQANVTLAGWQASNEEQSLLRDMVSNFESNNSNINVDYNVIQSKYKQKIKTQLGAQNAPDAFYVDAKYFPSFASQGALLNLSPYVEESDLNTDVFFESLINAFTWDGKLMGLPKGFNPLQMFYNKSHFDEAGATVPKSWDGWRTALTKIQDAGIVEVPMIELANCRTFKGLIYQNGGRIVNDDGSQCLLASEANIETLKYLTDMKKDGLIAIPSEIGAGWPGKGLRSEKASVGVMGMWGLPFIESKPEIDKQIDVAHLPTPSDGERGTVAYTVSYSASANTDHPAAAYELITKLTDKSFAKEWAQMGVPSRKSLQNWEFYDEHPRRKKFIEAGEWTSIAQWGPHSEAINNRLQPQLEAAMLQEKTPQQALETAEKKINSEILS